MLTSQTQEQLREHVASATSPLVAISILNWNGWQDTLECLESVRRLDYPNYLTVVVDNGSWNGSTDKIKGWAEENLGPGHVLADYTRKTALAGGIPEIEQALDRAAPPARMVLIRNEENLGFTGGNNAAIHYALQRAAGADYVFLLNNDANPDPDCISQLVRASGAAKAGIVGATIMCWDGSRALFRGQAPMLRQFFSPLVAWQIPPPALHDGFWDSFYVPGSAMLISAPVLRGATAKHGEYLACAIFMYADEIVLSARAHKAGYRSVIASAARVRHKKAQSAGGSQNPLVYYYSTRNMIRAAREVLPLSWRGAFHLFNLPVCLLRALRKFLTGQPRNAWALLCGMVDGYRDVSGKWKHHDEEA